MKTIKISKNRTLNMSTLVIGFENENKIETIEFDIPEEYQQFNKKACFESNGKSFSKIITDNVLTLTGDITSLKEVDMAIEFFANEVVARTSKIHLIFEDTILGEDVQPDDPQISILDELIEEVNNLDVDLEDTTLTITRKDGTKKSVDTKGEKGDKGDPGAIKMQIVENLPEQGSEDTIYLVKKEKPGENNLYDEYIYTNGSWEHIGDTSIDLSDYYNKSQIDTKLEKKQDTLTAGDNISISEDGIISAETQPVFIINLNTMDTNEKKQVIKRILQYMIDNNKADNLNYGACSPTIYIKTSYSYCYYPTSLGTIAADFINKHYRIAFSVVSYDSRYQVYFEGQITGDFDYTDDTKKTINSVKSVTVSTASNQLQLALQQYGKFNYDASKTQTLMHEASTLKWVDVETKESGVDLTHYQKISGYTTNKTQVLKNINGTLTWVNE